jgi:hypothetical protein
MLDGPEIKKLSMSQKENKKYIPHKAAGPPTIAASIICASALRVREAYAT